MTNMKTSPNQKAVTVYKAPCDKENKYAKINIEAMSLAARTLDFKSFELWIYFAKNQDKHQFALSNAAVRNEFGMKKDSYDGAIANLISAGYLTKDAGNYFSFHEIPVEEEEEEIEAPRITTMGDLF